MTLLPVIELCDNFRVGGEHLIPFCLTDDRQTVVGLLWPKVTSELEEDNRFNEQSGKPSPWTFVSESSRISRVHFSSHINTPTARSATIQATTIRWHKNGKFADAIGDRLWRDELYSIYKNPFGPHDESNFAFEMERAACSLFGFVTYGIHMTVYYPPTPGTDEEYRIWVPRRSRTKQTWPGFLDNTIAGGISSRMLPFESLLKESMEEGGLREDVVRKHARAAGSISYFFRTTLGYLQPEIQYIYDLAIPTGLSEEESACFVPRPHDGEVESFELLPLSVILENIREKLFKTNCALVLVDFLARHGLLAAETEPNYLEILTRLHGRFDIDKW